MVSSAVVTLGKLKVELSVYVSVAKLLKLFKIHPKPCFTHVNFLSKDDSSPGFDYFINAVMQMVNKSTM